MEEMLIHNITLDTPLRTSTYLNTLKGIQLSITALHDRDYKHRMQIRSFKNGSVEFLEGMCYDLLLALQHSLQFSYKPLKGKTWIGSLPNGTLVGMVAQILEGEADIAIAQASMVMLRQPLKYITFLLPTSSGKLTAIFRQPDASDSRNIILETYNWQVWLGCLLVWITIFVSIFVTHFTLKVISTDSEKNGLTDFVGKSNSRDLILWFLATMACQGWHQQPGTASMRGIFITAMGFAYMNNLFYSASLTSDLASETIPIKTFSNLINSQLTLYGDTRLPVVRDLIAAIYSSRKHTHWNYRSKVMKNHYINVSDSIKKIQHSASAFVTFDDAAKSVFRTHDYSTQYFCEKISSVSVSQRKLPNAMFVRKGSPLKEIFNRKILLAVERGITFRLNAQYTIKTIVTCPTISQSYRGGLGLWDIYSAYIFVAVGITVGSVAVLVEQFWKYFRLRQYTMNE